MSRYSKLRTLARTSSNVICDPDTIASKPRVPVYDLPDGGLQVKRQAIGIDYVIVNGTVLLEGGEHTGALPGQVLRGPLYHAPR